MSKLCTQLTTAPACFDNGTVKTSVVAHYEYGVNASGQTILVATRYTDAAGVPVDTSAGTVTAGACVIPAPDVEWEKLYDVQADGTVVPFLRRSITSFDSNGVASTVVADFELDKTTEYEVTGTVEAESGACEPAVAQGVLTTWG